MNIAEPIVTLRVHDREVAHYVTHPVLADTLSPRPFLHPVRTLGGTPVTDALPEDHRWHLGAGLAVPDVAGSNLWGGRTYLRDLGYTWRADHGRIVHLDWDSRDGGGFAHRLGWYAAGGRLLLTEERTVTARVVPGSEDAWLLSFSTELTNPTHQTVALGSPATNGRPGGAGYGGFFWRAVADAPPRVFTATASGEDRVNGSDAPWLALTARVPADVDPGTGRYTLVFTGLSGADRWFVRSAGYPGVCAALAFTDPLPLEPGATLRRRYRVVVADGTRDEHDVAALVTALD
ncbi:PmoA family protein [Planosporangium sp. 12N6]|uniref:DUF6807 domain-containing protein n=1 Tax=Planosporangium spinosum TaxID=3402278 RepID=UPI003CF19834